jgi:hypothetical protein
MSKEQDRSTSDPSPMPTGTKPLEPLHWLLDYTGHAVDLSIVSAEAGLLLEGVCQIGGFNDLRSGSREPGAAWLDVRTHPLDPPMRLWIPFALIVGVSVDPDTRECMIGLAGDVVYTLRPLAP